jgi:hypothetical protein
MLHGKHVRSCTCPCCKCISIAAPPFLTLPGVSSAVVDEARSNHAHAQQGGEGNLSPLGRLLASVSQ